MDNKYYELLNDELLRHVDLLRDYIKSHNYTSPDVGFSEKHPEVLRFKDLTKKIRELISNEVLTAITDKNKDNYLGETEFNKNRKNIISECLDSLVRDFLVSAAIETSRSLYESIRNLIIKELGSDDQKEIRAKLQEIRKYYMTSSKDMNCNNYDHNQKSVLDLQKITEDIVTLIKEDLNKQKTIEV